LTSLFLTYKKIILTLILVLDKKLTLLNTTLIVLMYQEPVTLTLIQELELMYPIQLYLMQLVEMENTLMTYGSGTVVLNKSLSP